MKRIHIFVIVITLLLAGLLSTGCSADARQARSALKDFLTCQKYNQWEQVWGMLHSDSQAEWDSESEFVEKYNQPLSNLKSFKLEKAKIVSSWSPRNRDKTYSNVVEIPVTLVYSREYGEVERSDIIHAVKYDGQWKFFLFKR
jgi:acyl-CoA-binding protein